jgi:hypothetical protein
MPLLDIKNHFILTLREEKKTNEKNKMVQIELIKSFHLLTENLSEK